MFAQVAAFQRRWRRHPKGGRYGFWDPKLTDYSGIGLWGHGGIGFRVLGLSFLKVQD